MRSENRSLRIPAFQCQILAFQSVLELVFSQLGVELFEVKLNLLLSNEVAAIEEHFDHRLADGEILLHSRNIRRGSSHDAYICN